jgi:L-ascorbate metabolism protein UlaG (beta-lactamase superfamily)
MRIVATWYGTVALHIVVEDRLGVFLDPFFERPTNAWPKIKADPETVDLDPLDAIFVSHSHFDHIYNLPNLIRRYPSARAYVPPKTVKNCMNLCAGAIFKGHRYELPQGDWTRVHVVTAGDRMELASSDGSVHLKATAIKSEHVKFDAYSIVRALLNWKLWRRFGYYVKFMTGFPKKEVVGWELQFKTSEETTRIVFFGSMCKKFPEVLSLYGDCDYFIAPLAGRRDVLPHARAMTEALSPRAVIPVHHDDFFPPITHRTNTRDYEEWLADACPETKLIKLEPEQPTSC